MTSCKILLLVVAAALLLPVALLCQQGGENKNQKKDKKTTTELDIRISNKATQKPVKDAEVWVRSEEEDVDFEETLVTDKDGAVVVPDVPRGTVLIQVTVKGFQTHSKKYKLSGEKSAISIELQPESEEDNGPKNPS